MQARAASELASYRRDNNSIISVEEILGGDSLAEYTVIDCKDSLVMIATGLTPRDGSSVNQHNDLSPTWMIGPTIT